MNAKNIRWIIRALSAVSISDLSRQENSVIVLWVNGFFIGINDDSVGNISGGGTRLLYLNEPRPPYTRASSEIVFLELKTLLHGTVGGSTKDFSFQDM